MMAIAPVVFLVDDDASVRTSLTRLLESAGYVVEAFASAREFLAPRTIYRSVLPGAGRRARSPGSSCLYGLSPGARSSGRDDRHRSLDPVRWRRSGQVNGLLRRLISARGVTQVSSSFSRSLTNGQRAARQAAEHGQITNTLSGGWLAVAIAEATWGAAWRPYGALAGRCSGS
jgi:hypothetical protein